MTMLNEVQKEFHNLQAHIQRENKKLEILQKLIQEYNGDHPTIGKLIERKTAGNCASRHSGKVE